MTNFVNVHQSNILCFRQSSILWIAPFHSVDPWSAKDGIPNPYSIRKDHRNTWQITLATLSLSHTSRMIKHKHQPIIPSCFHHLKSFCWHPNAFSCILRTLMPISPHETTTQQLSHGARLPIHLMRPGGSNHGNQSFTHFPSRMVMLKVSQLPIAALILLKIAKESKLRPSVTATILQHISALKMMTLDLDWHRPA